MAEVIINVDTEKSVVKVSVDGKNIPDVQSVRIERYIPYDKPDEYDTKVDIISGTRDEENDISRTLITTCGKHGIEEKDALTDDLIKALKL